MAIPVLLGSVHHAGRVEVSVNLSGQGGQRTLTPGKTDRIVDLKNVGVE